MTDDDGESAAEAVGAFAQLCAAHGTPPAALLGGRVRALELGHAKGGEVLGATDAAAAQAGLVSEVEVMHQELGADAGPMPMSLLATVELLAR